MYPTADTQSLKEGESVDGEQQGAVMVSLISLIIIPHRHATLQAHSTVSCQHLLTVQSDFYYSKHSYRALERERGRERERDGGGRLGE